MQSFWLQLCSEQHFNSVKVRQGGAEPVPFLPGCAADAAREKFFVPESDHLTLLHVYQQWKNNGYRGDWCARHYLQGKGLKKAKEVSQVISVCVCGGAWQFAVRAGVEEPWVQEKVQTARLQGAEEEAEVSQGCCGEWGPGREQLGGRTGRTVGLCGPAHCCCAQQHSPPWAVCSEHATPPPCHAVSAGSCSAAGHSGAAEAAAAVA
jgi:hypothetical protein